MSEELRLELLGLESDTNVTEIWKINKKVAYESYLIGARGTHFVMCCLFAGIAIQFGSKKYHYPYTVGCFIFGFVIGILALNSSFIQDYTAITKMDPSNLMLIFLPILIFESSFSMDAHMFFRALPQCIALAVPGLLFCTALTALFAKYVLVKYNWSWVTTFIFGVIVSATDPVAVVALLKEMRMPHSFTILIEGESLLNDGVAIVLFEILEHHLSGRSLKVTDSLIELGKTCFGAPAFGYTLAKISEWILVRIYISPVSEMTITFVFAYATYLTAERFLGISAVVAVVLYGITLSRNKMCISPKSESLVYTDWRLLAVYANTLIFIFVGILASISLFQHRDYREFGLVFVTYLALTVFRSLMIILFYPILKYTGYSINWKQSIILSWGGLRGAVGLALATMLTSNPKIDAAMHVHKILVQVAGIIVLTLLVNANTLKLIMKWIKFKEITLVNRLSMGNALSSVKEIKEMSMRICKNDWKYRKADWACIYHHTVVDDPYKGGLYGDDPEMSSLYIPYGTCDDCALAILPYKLKEEEMEGLNEAARTKVLRAMKGHFWKQFRSGFIQRRTLKCLSVAADNASDIKKKIFVSK